MTYQKIITADGSITLLSEAFQEACHSLSGARNETVYNYIEGCEIHRPECHSILEIGFGTGLGLVCTDEFFAKTNPIQKKYFVSTEIDEDLIKISSEIYTQDLGFFPDLKKITKKDYFYHGKNERAEMIILIGDARETIQHFYHDHPHWPGFNAIYQDAFSPKKNPLLWTKEWFDLLAQRSKQNAILSTYSSAQGVRKALEKAGWMTEDRAGLPPKKSVTRAFFMGENLFENKYQRGTIPDLTDATFPKLF